MSGILRRFRGLAIALAVLAISAGRGLRRRAPVLTGRAPGRDGRSSGPTSRQGRQPTRTPTSDEEPAEDATRTTRATRRTRPRPPKARPRLTAPRRATTARSSRRPPSWRPPTGSRTTARSSRASPRWTRPVDPATVTIERASPQTAAAEGRQARARRPRPSAPRRRQGRKRAEPRPGRGHRATPNAQGQGRRRGAPPATPRAPQGHRDHIPHFALAQWGGRTHEAGAVMAPASSFPEAGRRLAVGVPGPDDGDRVLEPELGDRQVLGEVGPVGAADGGQDVRGSGSHPAGPRRRR